MRSDPICAALQQVSLLLAQLAACAVQPTRCPTLANHTLGFDTMRIFARLAAIAALSSLPIVAQAQACSAATLMTSSPGYLSCQGSFTGNLNGSSAELAQLSSLFGGTWSYAGKSDDAANGPFAGNPGGLTTGTISFDALVTGVFVIGVKAGNSYSFYQYDGGMAGILSLPFQSIGTSTNPNGIANAVSHLALYRGPMNVVPEPSTYLLMASGLAGLGIVSRRRRAQR